MITGHTELLCLVGDPVEHVRTPAIFNDHLARTGIDAVVVPAHVQPDALPAVVAGLRNMQNLRAVIVTIPHKIAIVGLCDELHPSARLMGAVNIVRRDRDGTLVGANFDGTGLASAIEAEVGTIAGRRVYVAGAGGVGRAIAFAIAQSGAARLAIHNRSTAKADALLIAVRQAFPEVTTARADDRPSDCDIAINATSLGLKPGDPLPFALDALPSTATVAEVIMNPLMTPLLVQAQARGLRIVRGDGMLHCQLAAWVDFLGMRPRYAARPREETSQ